MFLGEYRHVLDDKNRVAVPSKFRSQLKSGAVITRGLDACLFVYPIAAWREWASKVARLPISQARSRAFARLMLGGAMDAGLDSQGRIVLPDYLKEYALLKKNVVIAGLYDRIEVWDGEEWDRYRKQTERESGAIAETLSELGV